MRILKSLLGSFVAFVAFVLLALVGLMMMVVAINHIDWNRHPSWVKSLVAYTSSWELTKLGTIDIHVSMHPRLSLRDSKLQAQSEDSRVSQLMFGEFGVSASLWPLLKLNMPLLEVVRLVDADAVMQPSVSKQKASSANRGRKGDRDRDMVSISSLPKIKQGIVERLTVLQQDSSGNPPRQVIVIERLELSTVGSRLRFKGTGRLKQEEFVVSGWADEENAPVAYPFRLDLGIAQQKATLKGKLIPASALQSGFALEAGVEVEGEQLGPLLARLGAVTGSAPSLPPYEGSAVLTVDSLAIKLSQLKLTLGYSYGTGEVAVDVSQSRPQVDLTFDAERLHQPDFTGLIGTATKERKAAETADSARKPRFVFSPEPLPFDKLEAVDARVTLTIRSITGEGAVASLLKSAELKAKLDQGTLTIEPSTVNLAGGRIKIEGSMAHRLQQGIQIKFQVGAHNVQLGTALQGQSWSKQPPVKGDLALAINLSSHGQSMRQLASQLAGDIDMTIEDGEIAAVLIEALGLDITESIGTLLANVPRTPIRCLIASFDANQGLISSKAFVLATADSNVLGEASIDLTQETVDVTLQVRAKDFSIGSLQAPIIIKGPFRDPKLSLGSSAVWQLGAAVGLATLVNPLLGVLPLVEPGFADAGKCAAFSQELRAINSRAKALTTR